MLNYLGCSALQEENTGEKGDQTNCFLDIPENRLMFLADMML